MSEARPDREHLFLEVSRSLCPHCRRVVDAQVLDRDGRIVLRKFCPDHGFSEALLSSDSAYYHASRPFNKPGTRPRAFGTEVRDGCPYDCGLCPEHQQHTCLAILEINSGCNLRCPICFTSAGDVPRYQLDVPTIDFMLDSLEAHEGQAEVVQISGGEPTIHPELEEILRRARSRSIRHIMLNTNGIRLARDPELVELLAELEIAVYLQFDGFADRTYQLLRGEPLLETKMRTLEACARAGLNVVLVAAVARGVNEDEIGPVVDFALEHPAVRGVNFQPVFLEGRHIPQDPLDRVTVPDVVHAVAAQSRTTGFTARDFNPIPCCSPNCMAVLYAMLDDRGRPTPISRLIDVRDYLDYFANRSLPDLAGGVRHALEGLYSASSVGGSLKQILDFCQACNIRLPPDLRELEDRVFMVQVTQFMDVHNFELKRVMKCCVHQLQPDGKLVPFCAYNTVGYRERVTARMAAAAG